VISIGNIASGGTGKTQVVLRLVEELQARHPVIVLSRGYGRSMTEPVIWRAGDPPPSPLDIGDEPAVIASMLQRGAIGVGVDRVALLVALESEFHDAIVLIDDGFQHHQIERDCDIVLVDNATVQGALIPMGELREPFSALHRADIILVSDADIVPFAERWKGRSTSIYALAKPTARFVDVDRIPLDLLGRPVLVVTGIARPARVIATVRHIGAEVAGHMRYRDHARYDQRDVDDILESVRAHRAVCAVTTPKDAVKLARFPSIRDQLAVIDIRLELERESEFWTTVYSLIGPDNT